MTHRGLTPVFYIIWIRGPTELRYQIVVWKLQAGVYTTETVTCSSCSRPASFSSPPACLISRSLC